MLLPLQEGPMQEQWSMFNRKKLLITFIALILALVPAFLAARPAGAQVSLQAGNGEAVWFYRSCIPGNSGAVATWIVAPNPSILNRTSLNFQVKNAYPGYQLVCELYFANSGKIRFSVKEITVYNPNSTALSLLAVVPAGEKDKVLQSCGYRPAWGANLTSVPSGCRSKIKITLTLGQNVQENSRLDFAVRIRLEKKLGN
jgi:hypothetical protein